jgi:hypothetical protein
MIPPKERAAASAVKTKETLSKEALMWTLKLW